MDSPGRMPAIIFALSVIAALRTTPLYQATSKVAIFPENPNVLGFKKASRTIQPDYQYDVALETQAAILRSDALAMKVIEAMRLDRNPSSHCHASDLPETRCGFRACSLIRRQRWLCSAHFAAA